MTMHYPMRPILKALEPLATLPRVPEWAVSPPTIPTRKLAGSYTEHWDEANLEATFYVEISVSDSFDIDRVTCKEAVLYFFGTDGIDLVSEELPRSERVANATKIENWFRRELANDVVLQGHVERSLLRQGEGVEA